MAVPFTFGQALLQGLQAGQQNRQQREELAFRREAQQAAQALAERREERSASEFDRTLQNRQNEFNTTAGFERDRIDLQGQQVGIARRGQDLLESRYVDIEGPNGQMAQIDIRDLLADRNERARLALARRQYDPFTITNEQRTALGSLLEGGDIPGGSVTLPFQLSDIARNYLATSLDPIMQGTREEQMRALETTRATREALDQASRSETVDPMNIALEPGFMKRLGAKILPGMFSGPLGFLRDRHNTDYKQQRRKVTTIPEFQRLVEQEESNLEAVMNTPIESRGEVGQQVAEGALRRLDDGLLYLQDASLSDEERKRLENSIMKLTSRFASMSARTNPAVAQLNNAFQEAVSDGEYEVAAEIVKMLSDMPEN